MEATASQDSTRTVQAAVAERTESDPVNAPRNGTPAPAPPPAPAQTPPPSGDKPAAKSGGSPVRKVVIGLIVAGVVVVGGIYGVNAYLWGKDHVETDDAFITGNLVNIAPKINGKLGHLDLAEGDHVTKGQLVARLEDATQRAQLVSAEAALEAARSQVPQAESTLRFQEESTRAAIQKAQSGVNTQEARVRAAREQVRLAARTTQNQVGQAQAQKRAAEATAQQAAAQITTAEEAVRAQQQAVETADRAVAALVAKVAAAQADVDKADRDEARYKNLLAKEAVTQQQYDAVAAQQASAKSALASLNEQIAQAKSQAAQARVAVSQAQAQVAAAQKAARAAQEQVGVANAAVRVAQANQVQVPVQNANLTAAATQTSEAAADVEAARAGQAQIVLRRQQVDTARVAVKQAEASVKTAQVAERDTYIYAPTDGTVVRKTVNVGTSVSAGQTLVTITQGSGVYITANFKETQVGNLRVGQPVEIKVDAFPGKTFRGIVGSVNVATGATTSLLPPDNATGNFTKVVQRVPVKIAIVPGEGSKEGSAEDIARLRQGMSVVVTIETSDLSDHPDRVPSGYDRGIIASATRPERKP